MSRQIRPAVVLIAALGVAMSPLAAAWTPYGYGPYGSGQYPGYPEAPTYPQTEAGAYEPAPPPPAYPPSPYGSRMDRPYQANAPQVDVGAPPAGQAPWAQGYPGAGARSGGPWEPRDSGGRGFGPPSGFRLQREVSEDAYTLTIELNGMGPEEIQARAQGQWIILSRERTEQQVQNDSFDDGRGYRRSFSYSSGTASRRLSVPGDGDLSAMSREDGEDSVRIRIPRRSR